MIPDDATPPLVAASPVPPVVPDSEASDLLPLGACATRAGAGKCLHPPAFHHCIICACDGYEASGSGVVPDKPALAPEPCKIGADFPEHHHHASSADIVVICTRPEVKCHHVGVPLIPCPDASVVPAVTDDEAAADWPLIAAFLTATHGIPEDSQDDDDRGWAIEAIAGLRSAGFLIVHPMQRGPEDPTFVMPDITAVHHTKET